MSDCHAQPSRFHLVLQAEAEIPRPAWIIDAGNGEVIRFPLRGVRQVNGLIDAAVDTVKAHADGESMLQRHWAGREVKRGQNRLMPRPLGFATHV